MMVLNSGYQMMLEYLGSVYVLTNEAELGHLLQSISLRPNGEPRDSMHSLNWGISVHQAQKFGLNSTYSDLAYLSAICFLKHASVTDMTGTVERVCDDMRSKKYPELWRLAVAKVQRDTSGHRLSPAASFSTYSESQNVPFASFSDSSTIEAS